MKTALIATAIAGALAAPQAFAQANNFAGFNVGVNGNLATSSTEINTGDLSANVGDASQNASVEVVYDFDLGGSGVLGLGGTYSLTSLKSGSLVMAGSNMELRNKDLFTVYVEPGYALNNAILLYVKIAYVGGKGERTLNGVVGSQNYYGTGYGAGARALLNKHLYLQAEFLQSEYGERPIDGMPYKPSSTTGSIGLGLKF